MTAQDLDVTWHQGHSVERCGGKKSFLQNFLACMFDGKWYAISGVGRTSGKRPVLVRSRSSATSWCVIGMTTSHLLSSSLYRLSPKRGQMCS